MKGLILLGINILILLNLWRADKALEQAEHNKWLEEQIKPEILKKFFEEGF